MTEALLQNQMDIFKENRFLSNICDFQESKLSYAAQNESKHYRHQCSRKKRCSELVCKKKKKVSLKEQTNLHTLLISFLPQKQICEKTTVVINRYSQSNIEWYLQTAIDATRTRDFVKPG